MAKPKCEIKFDNNLNRIYYGGQTISGTAIITLDEDTKVNGIHITFNGRGECKWTTGAGKHKKTYMSEEYYLSTRINFVGFDNSSEIIVPRGVHTYHFSCTLPESLPSSFDGKFGYIKYFAIVIFDVPMEPNKSFELGFTIVKTMNLNHNIELKNPVAIEKNAKFLKCCCCICCLSDALIVKARIPIGGFIAGQIIPIKLDVINKSNQKVNRLKIGLYKIMKFTCNGAEKTRKDVKKLIDVETEGCKSGARKEFQHDLLVPSVIPTDATSNICDISYSIKVTAEVGCFHRNPVLFIPITIGTVSIIGSTSHNDNGVSPVDSNVVITTTIKPSRDTNNPPEIHLEPPPYDDVVIHRPTNSNNNNNARVGGTTSNVSSTTQTPIEEYYKS